MPPPPPVYGPGYGESAVLINGSLICFGQFLHKNMPLQSSTESNAIVTKRRGRSKDLYFIDS